MKKYSKPQLLALSEGNAPICNNGTGAFESGCTEGTFLGSADWCTGGVGKVECHDGSSTSYQCAYGVAPPAGRSYSRCSTGYSPVDPSCGPGTSGFVG